MQLPNIEDISCSRCKEIPKHFDWDGHKIDCPLCGQTTGALIEEITSLDVSRIRSKKTGKDKAW